jgi:hypothetical protein
VLRAGEGEYFYSGNSQGLHFTGKTFKGPFSVASKTGRYFFVPFSSKKGSYEKLFFTILRNKKTFSKLRPWFFFFLKVQEKAGKKKPPQN